MEGKTDVKYLKKAAEFLGQKELLQRVELRDGGGSGNLDNTWTGKIALDKIWKSITPQLSEVILKKIILLYDCDKPNNDDKGNMFKRHIPLHENHPLKKGIENLFAGVTIEKAQKSDPEFIKITTDKIGGEIIKEEMNVNEVRKTDLCNWLCAEGTKEDFKHFQVIFDLLEEILES